MIIDETIKPFIASQAEDELRAWFLDQALPLWSSYGVDHVAGGFFERLDPSLSFTVEPRRTRLVSRQIYWFSVGGSLGWHGPVDALVDHGFRYLLKNLVSSEGRVRASCDEHGAIVDDRQHLYDVAFVLFALHRISLRNPENRESEDLARQILMRLNAHPLGGYVDEITPELQCANPHMHLFEAFLAWSSLQVADHRFWCEQSSSLARLALERLINPETGLLPEHFDHDWCPLTEENGQRIEPGHQFEWSWLLARWGYLFGDLTAVSAAARLCSVAEQYGVDPARNVVIEAINKNLLPFDKTARLWQQTERLKAWHLQWLLTFAPEAYSYREHALISVLSFISGPRPGLWFDEMDSAGLFVTQPVKASSGYHLASAIEALSVSALSY
jgi:mannose/cellobiose epimerase-like protein (N-acyl-D-glucosamine 2-epimerase family)